MKTGLLIIFLTITGRIAGQFSISPTIGVEWSGISHHDKGQVKRKDLKVNNPDVEGLVGIEFSLQSGEIKISVVIDRKNMGESIRIVNDSLVHYSFYNSLVAGKGSSRLQLGGNFPYLALIWERFPAIEQNRKRIKIIYGTGLGLMFNKSPAYYRETQNAGHTHVYYGGDNYCEIEVFNSPNGIGIFLHLRGGLILVNKYNRERIGLRFFWSQGFRDMIHSSINYSYGYIPAGAGSGQKVNNYKFSTRGTTFGVDLAFPIYFKHPKRK